MSRQDTEKDIVETLGQVPDFFATMPDDTLAREWVEWKSFQLADSALTAREKHLIGLGVAAATHCPYCTYFHGHAAKMMGASDAQLEEAARFASDTAKYSAYLHGLQIPLDDFKKQADEMGAYLAGKAAEAQRKAA
jgi:AhpD family alkylhydroperoxidase